jgi:hypothetical protein
MLSFFNRNDLAKEFGLVKFLNGKDPSGKSCLNKLKFKRFLKFKVIRHLVFEIKRP